MINEWIFIGEGKSWKRVKGVPYWVTKSRAINYPMNLDGEIIWNGRTFIYKCISQGSNNKYYKKLKKIN